MRVGRKERLERETAEAAKAEKAKTAASKAQQEGPEKGAATEELGLDSKDSVMRSMKTLNLEGKVLEAIGKMDGDEIAKLVKHKQSAKQLVDTYVSLVTEDSHVTFLAFRTPSLLQDVSG